MQEPRDDTDKMEEEVKTTPRNYFSWYLKSVDGANLLLNVPPGWKGLIANMIPHWTDEEVEGGDDKNIFSKATTYYFKRDILNVAPKVTDGNLI